MSFDILILNIHNSLDIQGMTCCLIWLSTSNTSFNTEKNAYLQGLYGKHEANKEILPFKFHTTNFVRVTEGQRAQEKIYFYFLSAA